MKRTKKQFTVDRIVPESEGKLHIKPKLFTEQYLKR